MDLKERFDKFVKDSKRVLKVSRKPSKEEYIDLAKVTTMGVLVVGAVGFVIVLIGQAIGL